MSLQVEKLEKNMAKLTIEVDAAEFEKAIDKAYQKSKGKISIPGFRKGKAPRKMIEQMYGKEVFYEDAANELIPEAYDKALEECEEEIVSSPKIEVVQVEAGKNFIFTAEVALKPEVVLGTYKGVKVDKIDVTVSDEEVDAQIEREREANGRTVSVEDRPVKDGDSAVIDFEGFLNGTPFKGGKGENYSLEIGSHTFIPGFEEALVGLKAGDKKDVRVTFPENYHSEELKGKPVVFKVEIKEVKERVFPEFNKEFFEDLNVGGVESLDDLKKYIKENLLAEKVKREEDEYLFKCLDKVVSDAKFEIPEEMTEDEVNRLTREFSEKLSYQGLKLEDYLKYCNTNLNDFKATLKDEANKRIGYRLMMDAVVEKEKLEVSDEEVETALEAQAKEYQMTKEDFIKEIGTKELFKYDMLMKKAMSVITE